MIFHIFGALAEFERSIIIDRTKAGLAAAKLRGRTGGRPSKLKESDLRAAKALLNDGELTVVEVAKRLQVSSAILYHYLPAARSDVL